MIVDKFDRDENPDWEPHALVEVNFTNKKIAVKNGYCPLYKIKEDYLTSTKHWFIEKGEAAPNEVTQAFVNFITPDAYPHSLVVGGEVDICEGRNLVGKAKIQEVYLELLCKYT